MKSLANIQKLPGAAVDESSPDVAGQGTSKTKGKRAEKGLWSQKNEYGAMLDATDDAIFVHEIETGQILDVNRKACEMFGYSKAEFRRLDLGALGAGAPPYTREDAARWIGKATRKPQFFEWTAKAKDGRLLGAELKLTRAAIGGKDRVLAVVRDIRDPKRAEEPCKRSDERLESFFTHAPAGLLIVDDKHRFVRVNETAARANGLSADEHIGKTIQEVDPSLAPIIEPILRSVFATGRESMNMELSGTLPNSQERRHLLASFFPVPGIGGKRQVGAIVADITDRRRAEQDAEKVKSQLEAQLRQAQKMEAVGRLAGGVAHDFNNLLTVINGYAKMTLSSLSNHHPGREDLEEIVLAGERAADFARQLLAFSRRQVLQPVVLDLNIVIADLNKMLRRLIREDIELVTISGPELGRVMADPGQVEQVVMNLAVNARDAMPKGGKLVIETANEDVSDEYARNRPGMRPGEFVTLSVSDNGCGMDKETLARIFEPFFTTKEKGKGTGLGLCTIYGIVKQSEGYIGVQSEPGRGTTFKVYLPRTHQDVFDFPNTGIGESKPARGAETVLLVEDEDNLRKLALRVLERNGYRVYEADSGAAALKTWQEHQASIDLLVTDMVMPGSLSGRQLAERLRSEKQNLKVIYSSGHNDEMIGITFPLPRDFSFLRKPYNPSKLLQTVRDSLDGR